MKRSPFKIILIFMLIIVFGFLITTSLNAKQETYSPKEYSGSKYTNNELTNYNVSSDVKRPNDLIVHDATKDFTTVNTDESITEEAEFIKRDDINGLLIPELTEVTYKINVNEEGFYNIKINYYNYLGRNSNICRGVKINGEYQFSESKCFSFTRTWVDDFDVSEKRVDNKHDQKPSQSEKRIWKEATLKDSEGFYTTPYLFKFEKGENTITFVPVQEPLMISTITLYQEESLKSYQETIKEYEKNYKYCSNEKIACKVQAESTYEKSSPSLQPIANYSSFLVEPYARFLTRYNTIGGSNWDIVGDWISWEVDVEEEGLYQITLKTSQNFKNGKESNRILYINDEIPFSECTDIKFKYNPDWQNTTLGDDNGAYYFHLKKGKNIIKLENTIGEYKKTVRDINQVINSLNWVYRKVIMRTGVSPSKYHDFNLYDTISNLYETITECSLLLENAINDVVTISGSRSDLISSLERTKYQLDSFKESEKKIQTGLDELETNITSLGTWIQTVVNQPLTIDYIMVHGKDAKLPKAKGNFFQKIWNDIILLIGSFKADSSLKSSVTVDGPTIKVWITSGRDQSNLLRQIIDEKFTVQKNINVELELVNSSVLLPATLSGNGPDVAIGVAQNIPVNWGIRNSVLDLTMFSDFEEYQKNFYDSAITPFRFNNKTYALPDTQDFLIQFVRTDIFKEIPDLNDSSGNIIVPKTWDDVIDILPILQRQYLDYYIPNVTGALSPLMYAMIKQYGGSLYLNDGAESGMMLKESSQAFYDFVNFYNNYGFQVDASFANRFRTGEMPIGITNFSLYNTLSVSAPEIRGSWDFALLPGHTKEDGTVSLATTSSSTATIILAKTKNPDASWEFMKWWLGSEAQEAYARGLEAILGAAARYPTANIEAFSRLPFKASEYRMLEEQRKVAVGIPVVPGDYIVGRYIDNAFRRIINNGINPSDSLFTYYKKINIELTRKRKEFNLDE